MLKLIHGDNIFQNYQKLSKLRGKALVIDGEELNTLDMIVAGSDNLSMFVQSDNTILLQRFFKNKSAALKDQLLKFLEGKKGKIDLILWEDSQVDKRSKLYKFLKKYAEVDETIPLKPYMVEQWLEKLITNKRLVVDSLLVKKIAEQAAYDQMLLENEVERLRLLLAYEKRDKIVDTDLAFLTNINPETQVWDLLDAISSRNKASSINICNQLLKSDNDFSYVCAMITRQLKVLLLLMDRNITKDQISVKLKIHPFTLSKAQTHLYKFETNYLKLLYSKLVNLDFAVKQGRIDPRLGLNLFLASI